MEHWADVDNRLIDFAITTLPPQLLTLTDAQIKANNDAFQKPTTNEIRSCKNYIPQGEVIQGHMFWGSSRKRGGLQRYVLARADTLRHNVCVILEDHDRRLYGSFQDRFQFWRYYSSFKGDRCFYWINRSFECQRETTLLHLDISWCSSTCDPAAKQKLDLISETIWAALSRKVPLIKENLSRWTHKSRWKNSWHIYADVTMKHNAEGCMKDFVEKEIWGRLKHRGDMWCGINHKPLINLLLYTKDWAFKVVGSVKWRDT